MTFQREPSLPEHSPEDDVPVQVWGQQAIQPEAPLSETGKRINPFENTCGGSDGAATPDLLSADPEGRFQVSKRAPTRAVFDDFTAAVSSIRSGSAPGRYRSDSHQLSYVSDEDPAIPLQDLQPIEHREEESAALGLPISCLPPASSQSNYFKIDTTTFAARGELPVPATQPIPPEQSWNPFRRNLAALSVSFNKGGASDLASRRPRNSSDPLEPVKRHTSRQITGSFQDEENHLRDTPNQYESNGGSWSKFGKHVEKSSLQEGSTLDNIVKQYKRSDVDSNTAVDWDSHSRPAPSFDPQRSQLSDDSFFKDSYQANHARPHPHMLQRKQRLAEEHASQPPTYDLPRLPNYGFPRSEARHDLASVTSSDNLDLTNNELDESNLNNPFRTPRDRGSTRIVLDDASSTSIGKDQNRQPLERAIMQLRHRSDYSTNSVDSLSTIRQEGPSAGPACHAQLVRAQMERYPSEIVSIDEETRRLAEPVLFYDQTAIDPNWNIGGNGLRVPVRGPNRYGNSKQSGNAASRGTDSNSEDDQEDWETVVTDAGDHEAKHLHRFGGLTNGQSESSVAESSDDGAFNACQEVSGFSSIDRVIQHPGKIHYHGDYRQLDLKNMKVPVMAPKYGAHRVNGYAADSMRTRSPYPYYTSPSPLANSHRNPFSSRPPEVMSPKVRKPTGMPKPYRGKTHFLPSSKASSIIINSSEAFPRATIPQPKLALKNEGKAWKNDRDEVCSTFSTQNSLFMGHDGHNPQRSWAQVGTFANLGSIPGYNHDRPRFTPQNRLLDSSNRHISRAQAGGFTKVDLHCGRDIDFDRRPTNSPDRRPSGKNPRNDFMYRSPLAPPQRNSCRALYTKSQLGRIDFAGDAASMSRGVREPPFEQGFDRAFERHTSFGGLRQRPKYDREEADRRRKKISNVCLGLCNLFPPLLILYATGNLDIIIFWWSKAEFARFKARQKQLACYLLGVWAVLLLIILATVLVVWKVHSAAGQKGA